MIAKNRILGVAVGGMLIALTFTPCTGVSEPVSRTSALRALAQAEVDRGLALGDNSDGEAEFYERAIEIDPLYAAAYFNLGFVRQTQKRLEDAIAVFERCLLLDPDRADAHRNIAVCWQSLRGDAALPKVRHHINAAIEKIESLPGISAAERKLRADLPRLKAELSAVEQQMGELGGPPAVAGVTSAPAEMAAVLSRRVLRGEAAGQRIYDGPRLVLEIFDGGQAQVPASATPVLRSLVRAITTGTLQAARFTIVGHADAPGPADHNLVLSARRAKAVRDFLVREGGIDSARVDTEFRGEDVPLCPDGPGDPRRLNRRIEIVRRSEP